MALASMPLEAIPPFAPHCVEMLRDPPRSFHGTDRTPDALAPARLQSVPTVARGSGRRASSTRPLFDLMALLRIFWHRAQQRHELAQLSDEQLRDIGISRATAARETEKPFWQE